MRPWTTWLAGIAAVAASGVVVLSQGPPPAPQPAVPASHSAAQPSPAKPADVELPTIPRIDPRQPSILGASGAVDRLDAPAAFPPGMLAFLAGLDWAIERGVQVANLSLSSKSDALYGAFHEVADEAAFKGVALVSAANNVRAASYPSLFSSVFSVAAHGEPDPWRWYLNPAPPVEFGAWGVDVPIAWKDGATTVATGNSFAAPHIAGLLARMCAKHPGLTPFEAKAILAATADEPTSLGDG